MRQKIYLVCDKHNTQLAHELLQENQYHIADLSHLKMQNKISGANIVILLDDKPSVSLLKQIGYAKYLSVELEECSIIPIIIGDAYIPSSLKNDAFLKLNPKSLDEKKEVRAAINNLISANLINHSSNARIIKKRDSSRELILLTTMAAAFTAIISIVFTVSESNLLITDEYIFYLVYVLVIGTMTLVALTYTISLRKKSRIETENELYSYSKRLSNAISINPTSIKAGDDESNNSQEKVDALGRMLINLEDIKEFYTWSQKQAKTAFILAITMCILGFILIATAIVFSLVSDTSANVPTIAGVSGVITEIIAGTALVVYKNSLSQLNHYHRALHEDERFLSSATLVDKFSNDIARDEMLKEIIRSELQMNLETNRQALQDKNN